MVQRSGVSPVLNMAVCGSTNKEAMRLALSGETGPMWVHAQRQDEGRGRSGRAWVSVRGNLFASMFVRISGPLARAGQLSLVAGVAVADAISMAALERGLDDDLGGLWLKWPNDTMIGNAKCGGLLVETCSMGPHDYIAVIGVGLNLQAGPEIEGRESTSLRDHGLLIPASDMLAYLDRAMLARLPLWQGGDGFGDIQAAWLARAGKIGTPISVHEGEDVLEGTFNGLGDDGCLLIRLPTGVVREVSWGDVILP